MKTNGHDRTAIGAILVGTGGALALAILFFALARGPQVSVIEIERVAVPVPSGSVPEAPEAPRPPDAQPPPQAPEAPVTREVSEGPTFTPFEVAPRMTNVREVQSALQREYPALLRDAGIGGRVLIWLFIDEEGVVQETRLRESSGHAQLDAAALAVAGISEFIPAMKEGKNVPVWISLPSTFVVR